MRVCVCMCIHTRSRTINAVTAHTTTHTHSAHSPIGSRQRSINKFETELTKKQIIRAINISGFYKKSQSLLSYLISFKTQS